MSTYDFKKIEKRWQKFWLDNKTFKASDVSKKQKYYQLETFPYPSAAGLHVGHPKGYIAEDIHARYKRMKGFEVLYTMGWDAFGLPTENYAIKVGKSPKEVAEANVKNFKRQVQMFGLSYDWDREINTSSPEYYKWTQWIFLQLFKKGLAYRAKGRVNWCPKDQTVLANEQVIQKQRARGKEQSVVAVCERCETPVEQREMEQWFFKITDYAERLLEDLKGLDWPTSTIKRQEDWIGRSEGAELQFPISNSQLSIKVFTTRPDTLFGATYMVLAPEHPLVAELIGVKGQGSRVKNVEEVEKYITTAKHKTELMRQEEAKDKTGVELKGVKAINPATKEEISIWIADYVLMGYGTGAIMAVPAHDERDYEFAKKFDLPIKTVIEPETGDKKPDEQFRSSIVAIVEDPKSGKFLTLNWGPKLGGTLFIGGGREGGEDEIATALREIREETGYTNLAFVGKTERMHHHYFAFSKNVPRNIEVVGLHFRLIGNEQEAQNHEAHEKGNFEVEWLTKEEVLRNMEDENHLLSFRRLVLGEIYTGKGIITGSGKFDGMDSEKAKWEITKFVGGERKFQYKIRDWSVSRQRYWGAPIPIIYCRKCWKVSSVKRQASSLRYGLDYTILDGKEVAIHSVAEADLPVLLPELENYRPRGVAPLASSEKFLKVKCPQCKGEAKRDPETLDTFVDSSWYYLRYTDPKNDKEIFDKKKAAHWLPVDLYVIGAEHTVLHLLYSRFITKFLRDEGYLNFEEPFLKLRHQGLILGEGGQKMSKSKGNVVNPDEVIDEFGADTLRMYEMFMGPFEDGAPWDTKGILGVERFLRRVWNLMQNRNEKLEMRNENKAPAIKKFLHKTIKKVTEDIENLKFNTAISALMIFFNEMEKQNPSSLTSHLSFLKLLHPFVPHLAQELWDNLGNTTILDFEPWPKHEPSLIIEDTFTLVIQVNGKVRDSVEVSVDIGESEAGKIALEREKVRSFLGSRAPQRVIYVSKKLVNIVT
ncbi:MAG: class I tRNA ligase family protein [Candidatus Liptonbacteria bacterium]|nr:class I tRNA ligase family protein [Candidatus Liptonbacteria bacterium]